MKEFEELYELLKKNREVDPWADELGLKGFVEEMNKEAVEAKEALVKKDYEHFKEELGDVLMDLISTTVQAEKKGLFSIKDIMRCAMEKMHARKPHLKNNQKVDMETAKRNWEKAKNG